MVSDELLIELFKINAVKFGEFELKGGCISPVYFDFRSVISYPKLLCKVSEELWKMVEDLHTTGSFDLICGVPFAALSLASTMCTMNNVPMLMKRKEAKSHGTRNMIEGVCERGDKCLIIEDVITSGLSVYETAKALRDVGVEVNDVAILLDRQQGGHTNLINANINVHSLINVKDLLDRALQLNFIDIAKYEESMSFFSSHPVDDASLFERATTEEAQYLPLEQRILSTPCVFNRKLMQIVLEKQSNLCVAVDLTSCNAVLELADQVGPHICLLKTHIDVIDDFNDQFLSSLKELAERHNFLLFEDRKFADIGATVKLQYKCRHYKINEYFDVVNAHIVPGPSVIDGLYQGRVEGKESACILLSEMSSEGNLFDDRIKKGCLELTKKWPSFVSGFVCQSRIDWSGNYLHYTPGVTLALSMSAETSALTDGLGQQYKTPQTAIDNGADIIIIGRAITQHAQPKIAAQAAKKECFSALINRSK